MKAYSQFIFALAVMLALIWLLPGLSLNTTDSIFLSMIVSLYCVVFIFGAGKITRSLNVSQSQFNARYFGSMGIRIIIALISIAIYLKFSTIVNKFGAIFLLISYFVYMGFEIRIILHKLRTDSEKSQNTDDARK